MTKQPPPTIYFDNAATTPVAPEVVEAMRQVMLEDFGNPSSRHVLGLAAERHLQRARRTVADRLGVAPEQILFCSGGSDHGEHGVKTKDCTILGIHPLGESAKGRKLPFSEFSVPSVVIELRFLG